MSNKLVKNSIAVERGKRLKFLRSRVAAMTGEEFAKYCGGLARGTITNWEKGKGKTGLKEKGAKVIEQAMRDVGIACSVDWLLDGEGEPPKITNQNKLSRLYYPVHEPVHSRYIRECNSREPDGFLEEVDIFKKRYPSHLLYTFQDESMSPIYHTYDCVGGPRLMSDQFTDLQGSICIVLLQSNQLLVRCVRLERSDTEAMSFYVINPEFAVEYPPIVRMPSDSITALAPITRLWRNRKA